MFDLEKIIEGCKKNKRKAQMYLYEHYAALLLGVCIRYAESKPEAEDILQEAFLKIFDNIDSYTGKGNFEGWMKRIVINTAITHYHKNKKYYHHQDVEDMTEEELKINITPDTEYSVKELHDLLAQMPEGYRMVFNLYAVEGYKHKEIAEKLNIDESTSKSQYLRAKNWVVKQMQKMNWENE
ncbi:MAG: sigma-70 family RNA polymerase sigma factor [Bacteroidetes bacterium]|jgi:RNA polymerase sigma-70 factor (ECF subfamily)|nr:sigma-70 family RNA polymerase sigma factor [Bacteroidota bacterium]